MIKKPVKDAEGFWVASFGKCLDPLTAWHHYAKELEDEVAYLEWRLKEIIPLFQEARDALPAITEVRARLHSVNLSLGNRMDAAGTRTREDFDKRPK